jgi:hypothetical protein
MESSTVLAFRIFVMLSCLIIVPMAAIFGSAFPDVVKSVLVDRIVALSTGKPVEPSAAPDPNGFREVTTGSEVVVVPAVSAPGVEAPRWGTPEGGSAWPREGSDVAPAGATPAVVPVSGPGDRPGDNQSASFSMPVNSEVVPAAGQVPGSPPVQMPQQLPASEAGEASPYGSAPPVNPAVAAADRMACPLEQPDRFTEMERRLREYGATYYLLETWGNAGELYRFHCRMAVANNGTYSRHFEATDRDALKAMSDVLAQVQAWRSGPAQ